jgi:hypothetical protein
MKRLDDLVQDHRMIESIENLERSAKHMRQVSDVVSILQTALDSIGMKETEAVTPSNGGYGYVPLEMSELFELMFLLEEILTDDADYKHSDLPHRPIKFLEVGCGIGRNVHLLSSTNRFHLEKVDGFDIVEDYINVGKKHFGSDLSLFVDDCMTFDYGGYDVIYFYRPLQDERLEKRFEDHLVESMKSGAYIVGCFSAKLETSRRLIRKDDGGRIWKRV